MAVPYTGERRVRKPTEKDLKTILRYCKQPWKNEDNMGEINEWAYEMDATLRKISKFTAKILGVESPLQ